MRWIRLAPVTSEVILICVAIFISCTLQATLNHERFEVVQRSWGAIRPLELIELHDGVRKFEQAELRGPFDVWNGEWWRIPVTSFHHSDLMQLVLLLGLFWYLGSRLENHWGSIRTMLFLVPASLISVMAELIRGEAVEGLSGTICAILGTLVVLRRNDVLSADQFPDEIADLGMASIILCWIAAIAGIATIPNVAHLTGFGYGSAMAFLVGRPFPYSSLARIGVALAHLAIIPGFNLVSEPTWIGRYHWHRAMNARSDEEAEVELGQAIRCDRGLTGAWLRWSRNAELQGELPIAWSRLMEGLAANPSSAPLIDSGRRLWRHLDPAQRHDAESGLRKYFGKQAGQWLAQIRAEIGRSGSEYNEKLINKWSEADLKDFSLDQKLELPMMQVLPTSRHPPGVKWMIDENDAAEGETL